VNGLESLALDLGQRPWLRCAGLVITALLYLAAASFVLAGRAKTEGLSGEARDERRAGRRRDPAAAGGRPIHPRSDTAP